MQLITLVIALLAGVFEAGRSHRYRLMTSDSTSGATCYRNNQKHSSLLVQRV
ncbi:hypothetical protein CONCODRAFT_11111 [Conidiobolus coronatus NRRL 28638]|uniref:Uncharacterized protein n=1 Tax=Conidiobolus coronatus (strain ATCC 28846 / CBS 209.66 / NRRL 28638) TaxID=796925 RepID=A0A137NWB5_CONC2|nr:hypothetical protein CONCODRAFT_11111 [Conidiobolus coronatus NRRL 28638]|eukprot:KXN66941.1 hypothetical protein CONCODRAFT_11111 [Conidiobolus coronatus NRRL 28638]